MVRHSVALLICFLLKYGTETRGLFRLIDFGQNADSKVTFMVFFM